MNNNIKLTETQIDDILNKYNYKRIEEYKNNVRIIKCENIDTKYRYSIEINHIQNIKPSLWGISNEENLDYNVKLWLKNNVKDNIEYLGYEKVIKSKTKRILVKLKCSCGNNFVTTLTKMVNNGYKVICCDDCKLTKHKIYGIKKGTKKHLEIIENKGYKIIDKEYYLKQKLNVSSLVDVEDKEGYRGSVSSNLCNKAKSFTKFSPSINKKYFKYNINLFYKKNEINCECIDGNHNKITLKCQCGNKFDIECKYIRYVTMCKQCSNTMSMLEKKVADYLSCNNIKFMQEYRFNDCKDKIPLPFDFYLPNNNVCIETDGKQHYKVVEGYFGGTEDFNKRKYHEEIKNKYCEDNNIKLIRIPYYEFENDKDNWKEYLKELVE